MGSRHHHVRAGLQPDSQVQTLEQHRGGRRNPQTSRGGPADLLAVGAGPPQESLHGGDQAVPRLEARGGSRRNRLPSDPAPPQSEQDRTPAADPGALPEEGGSLLHQHAPKLPVPSRLREQETR